MTALPSSPRDLARLIDHTALAPTLGRSAIDKLCDEALEHDFCSVCVQPCWVAHAAERLAGAEPRVCTVIGFPLGCTTSASKAAEARGAIAAGAEELDMVMNLGWLLSGDEQAVRADVAAVVEAAGGRLVKVILESARLDLAQIELASRLAVEGGAHFVKTSTGFGPGGASVEAVACMRATVGPDIGVKASGGIRDAAAARAMLEAGASRIGASASLALVAGWAE